MTRDKIFAAFLLADFVALNVWAFATTGWDGFVAFLTGMGPWEMVLTADLVIMLALAAVFIFRDARARGANGLGPAILTMFTGSIGPLLYVIRRRPVSDAR